MRGKQYWPLIDCNNLSEIRTCIMFNRVILIKLFEYSMFIPGISLHYFLLLKNTKLPNLIKCKQVIFRTTQVLKVFLLHLFEYGIIYLVTTIQSIFIIFFVRPFNPYMVNFVFQDQIACFRSVKQERMHGMATKQTICSIAPNFKNLCQVV